MKKSFLVTGNFPVYEIQGNYTRPGVFDSNVKPSFIVFGQIFYEKFYCELKFKLQQEDYLFEKEVPSYELRLDISSLSILEGILHEALHNSSTITPNGEFVRLCNTASGNTAGQNQKCAFVTSIPEMVVFNIYDNATRQYKQFRIMGYFQLLSFMKFIENIKQLYLNSYSSWDFWKNFQAEPVPPIPQSSAPANFSPSVSITPTGPNIKNSNGLNSGSGGPQENRFNTAPESSDAVAPTTSNAPNKPGASIPAVPGIPEIPEDL